MAKVNGKKTQVTVDAGAMVSIMKKDIAPAMNLMLEKIPAHINTHQSILETLNLFDKHPGDYL